MLTVYKIANLTKSNHGFSLIEVMGAIAILSVGLPALAYAFFVSLNSDSISSKGIQAHFLADSLISEISQRRFRESAESPANGPDEAEISGYDRTAFDDISDYKIFADEWGPLSPPRGDGGNYIEGLEEFSQYVEVVNVAAPSANGGERSFDAVDDGSTDFKRVTVTISWNGGKDKISQSKIFVLTP